METKIGKHTIKVYTDIEETPSERYSKFNKYMTLNEKVGSNFNDVDIHFSKLYTLINDPIKLKAQLDVFRQLVFSLDNEQSFNSLAYACLVYSIDGEERNDLTVNGLKETSEKLQWIKSKDVKKKLWNLPKMHILNLSGWMRIFSTNQT